MAQMARLVADAQSGKAKVQRLADRVSAVFVPIVIVLAAATLGVWLAVGAAVGTAFAAAVAVLIIACPCALGLATPTALLVGTGRGAQLGILIKGPEVLESTRRVDTVLLDKTGTITTGTMSLVDVLPVAGENVDDVLRRAAAVEAFSEHPVAVAVTAGARQRLRDLPAVTDFRSVRGNGVRGVVNCTMVLVGRPGWLAEQWSVPLPETLRVAAAQREAHGRTVIAVAWDGQMRGQSDANAALTVTVAPPVVAHDREPGGRERPCRHDLQARQVHLLERQAVADHPAYGPNRAEGPGEHRDRANTAEGRPEELLRESRPLVLEATVRGKQGC